MEPLKKNLENYGNQLFFIDKLKKSQKTFKTYIHNITNKSRKHNKNIFTRNHILLLINHNLKPYPKLLQNN